MMLADTGLRAGELCNLMAEDVDRDSGRIRVKRGKGGKGRTVFASRATVKALEAYWTQCNHPGGGTAFTTTRGSPLTVDHLYHLIRNIGKRAGVDVHSHALRHFFALEFLRNSGDALSLKRLLGHSTLKMVERYVSLLDDDLEEAHHRASPVAKMMK